MTRFWFSWVQPTGDHRPLTDGYAVIRPIPYTIERIAAGDYRASFAEANIAIGGRDPQDAYQSLVAEILDTYEVLEAEATNSPHAQAQLDVLRTYIGKT